MHHALLRPPSSPHVLFYFSVLTSSSAFCTCCTRAGPCGPPCMQSAPMHACPHLTGRLFIALVPICSHSFEAAPPTYKAYPACTIATLLQYEREKRPLFFSPHAMQRVPARALFSPSSVRFTRTTPHIWRSLWLGEIKASNGCVYCQRRLNTALLNHVSQ